MPRSNQRKGSRHIQRQIGKQRRSAPEVGAAESAAPEKSVGIIILPLTIPISPAGDGLRRVAGELQGRGFTTFLAELLTSAEREHGYHNFDLEMLADRIAEVTERLRRKAPVEDLPIGYFGTSTDAAAMAVAAARSDCPAGALVMCNARPELASAELPRVRAPTLFIVEDNEFACDLNRAALGKLRCRGDLAVLRGASSCLTSAEVASEAARLAGDWFETHLR
jgi:putative phosphoribosyl transferase